MIKRRDISCSRSCARVFASIILGSTLCGCARTGHYFSPRQTVLPESTVAIPVYFEKRYVFADVELNGAGPYRFLLDTGASLNVISSALAIELDAKRIDDLGMYVGGATGAVDIYREFVELDELRIGAASFRQVRAVVADHLGLSGVLSLNLFRDVLLTLDYPNESGTVALGALPEPDGLEVVLLLDHQGKIALLELNIQDTVQRVMIDTGAPIGLILQRDSKDDLGFESGPIPGFRVRGVYGSERMWMGRLAGVVRIGKHVLSEPVVRFSRAISILGYDVLRHFEVSFDMTRRRVRFRRLAPAAVSFDAIEGYPLKLSPLHTHAWVVTDVLPRSIAYDRGIREGQRVLAINGQSLPARREIDTSTEARATAEAILKLLQEGKRTLRLEFSNGIVEVPWVVLVP